MLSETCSVNCECYTVQFEHAHMRQNSIKRVLKCFYKLLLARPTF